MANKDLEMVVGTVVARLSDKHSVGDAQPEKTLKALGIESGQFKQFKKLLYCTLSSGGMHGFNEFAEDLEVRPSSTIATVAAAIPRTYRKPLVLGRRVGVAAQVRAAVHTTLAQATKTHSVFEITPNQTLRDLGLRPENLPGFRTNLYRTLCRVDEEPIGRQHFLKGRLLTTASTVSEIADETVYLLNRPGSLGKDAPMREQGASLPGTEGRRRKGGFPPPSKNIKR